MIEIKIGLDGDYPIYWGGQEIKDVKKKRLLHQVLFFPLVTQFLEDCLTLTKLGTSSRVCNWQVTWKQ